MSFREINLEDTCFSIGATSNGNPCIYVWENEEDMEKCMDKRAKLPDLYAKIEDILHEQAEYTGDNVDAFHPYLEICLMIRNTPSSRLMSAYEQAVRDAIGDTKDLFEILCTCEKLYD